MKGLCSTAGFGCAKQSGVLLASICLLAIPISAQEIRIKVLDGRNGHPVTDERLNVWVGDNPVSKGFGGEGGKAYLLPTDKSGIVVFQLGGSNPQKIDVAADYYV